MQGIVPVRFSPEPNNQFDAKANAFQCYVEGKWQRVGYVVREVLDEVHQAMNKKKVVDVRFAWVKYMVV